MGNIRYRSARVSFSAILVCFDDGDFFIASIFAKKNLYLPWTPKCYTMNYISSRRMKRNQ